MKLRLAKKIAARHGGFFGLMRAAHVGGSREPYRPHQVHKALAVAMRVALRLGREQERAEMLAAAAVLN